MINHNDPFEGVWIVVIGDRTQVVTVEQVHDGGMVEFTDAVTGKVVGCAGIHWWRVPEHRVKYGGTLPQQQDPKQWILPERSPYAS
jgi:hypothetical protein